MYVMGIDPGTIKTGFGIVDMTHGRMRVVDYGVVRADAKQPLAERLLDIYDGMCTLMSDHQLDQAVIEQPFVAKNPSTALALGHARGMLLLLCQQRKLPLAECTPTAAKKNVVGHGRASKQQMQWMIMARLGLKSIPAEDAADALGIAVTWWQQQSLASL